MNELAVWISSAQNQIESVKRMSGERSASSRAQVFGNAAIEAAKIYFRLTGRQPTRVTARRERRSAKGGIAATTSGGPWREFLGDLMWHCFGTTTGVDGYAQTAVEAMKRTLSNS